jgi:hypothetical protein
LILGVLFDQGEDNWFFRKCTRNFTVTKDLFLNYPNETLRKFELTYTFQSMNSLSALIPHLVKSILQIEIQVLFLILNVWIGMMKIRSKIIHYMHRKQIDRNWCFSPIATFDVRLPAGNDVHLVIHIRDQLDSITVLPNLTSYFQLINNETEILSSENQKWSIHFHKS